MSASAVCRTNLYDSVDMRCVCFSIGVKLVHILFRRDNLSIVDVGRTLDNMASDLDVYWRTANSSTALLQQLATVNVSFAEVTPAHILLIRMPVLTKTSFFVLKLCAPKA